MSAQRFDVGPTLYTILLSKYFSEIELFDQLSVCSSLLFIDCYLI